MDAARIRQDFIDRTTAGSPIKETDIAMLERFDRRGLGSHPKVLAMLAALTGDSPLSTCCLAKEAVYRLLEGTPEPARYL